MADVFNKTKRSEIMAAIKSKGNKDTELKLIAIFLASGIAGWRRHQKLPGKPDFVFRREGVAVFVDGCFWHGCPKHCRMPKGNRQYWQSKIERNRARDRQVSRMLRKQGWRVLRVWGHALASADKVASRIILSLNAGLEKGNNANR